MPDSGAEPMTVSRRRRIALAGDLGCIIERNPLGESDADKRTPWRVTRQA
jgi:hypothetical protein